MPEKGGALWLGGPGVCQGAQGPGVLSYALMALIPGGCQVRRFG